MQLPVLLICAGGLLILQGLLYSALLAGYGENQMVQGSLNLLGLCEFGVFVACNVLLFKLGHCVSHSPFGYFPLRDVSELFRRFHRVRMQFILVRVMGITYIAITYLSLIGGVVARCSRSRVVLHRDPQIPAHTSLFFAHAHMSK